MREGGLATSRYGTHSFRAPGLPFEVDGVMLAGGGDLPEIGADTMAVLGALGLAEDQIARASGRRDAA